MSKSENKTKPTGDDVIAWLEGVDNATRRQDAFTLLAIMKRITGCEPVLWGSSIVGFDQYHYKYESGREGDMCLTGFSPRKGNLAIYIMAGFDGRDEMLARLGKHKIGKSCLYVNKLADIDMAVLEQMIENDVAWMREKYH